MGLRYPETPADVHAKLVSAVNRGMRTPEMTKYFEATGFDPMFNFGPAEMGRYQADEYQRFKGIADTIGVKPE